MIINLQLHSGGAQDALPLEVDPAQPLRLVIAYIESVLGLQGIALARAGTVLRDLDQSLAALGVEELEEIRVVPAAAPAVGATTQVAPQPAGPPPRPPAAGWPLAGGAPSTVSAPVAALAEQIRSQLLGGAAPPPIDPMSEEGQRRIYEAIRMSNIQRNLAEASQTIPESFFHVTMLYINVEINGVPFNAFVDSGAQASLMTLQALERAHLAHLLDTRYQGVLRGVGERKIQGRVHKATITCGGVEFDASFTVMDAGKPHILFGLDLLKRHQCNIDLKRNVLRIADVVDIPFLSDAAVVKEMEDDEHTVA